MTFESFHLSRDDLAKWREIAAASAAIIAVAQRNNGLWSYPVNDDEVVKYNDGSAHQAFKENYGSYTATWSFLLALERLYGQLPDRERLDIENWFRKNPPDNGAYGRPIPRGLTGGPHVDATARHTGYALLIRLRYLQDYRRDEWPTIVNWILANRTAGLGWRHRHGDIEDEPMATGACIAALSYFISLKSQDLQPKVLADIHVALVESLNALLDLTDNSRLWSGHRAGSTDVLDSALIIELFSLPEVRIQLEGIKSKFGATLRRLKSVLLTSSVGAGWPYRFGGKEVSLSATANTVLVTFEEMARNKDNGVRQRLMANCHHLLEQFDTHEGGATLVSWEWAYVGSLCSAILRETEGICLSSSERRHLERATSRIRRRKFLLAKAAPLRVLPVLCYGPIFFIMSEGRFTFDKDRFRLFGVVKRLFKILSFGHKAFLTIKSYGLLQRG